MNIFVCILFPATLYAVLSVMRQSQTNAGRTRRHRASRLAFFWLNPTFRDFP